MASSSAGSYASPIDTAAGPSSIRNRAQPATVEDDSDNDDPVASYSREQAILADDPLEVDSGKVLSFKRKQKQPIGSGFLSALATNLSGSGHSSPSPRSGTPRNGRPVALSAAGVSRSGMNNSPSNKDGVPLDWYVEGPGKRVGYEDMTAIDWIFEYTKERQRLRLLYSSATGLLGYINQLMDASQIWVVLILTGLATGCFAAAIDIVSDWLGDLKTGYCSAGEDDGRFYLNKAFCCMGYDNWAQCRDWVPWSLALHITSAGGKWFIEYFFFIVFSVSSSISPRVLVILNQSMIVIFCFICKFSGNRICLVCEA